jgi:hypothetical protein
LLPRVLLLHHPIEQSGGVYRIMHARTAVL